MSLIESLFGIELSTAWELIGTGCQGLVALLRRLLRQDYARRRLAGLRQRLDQSRRPQRETAFVQDNMDTQAQTLLHQATQAKQRLADVAAEARAER